MHHKIWLTLISALVLGSVGGYVTTTPQTVNAARRSHRVRIRRRRTHFRRPRIRLRRRYQVRRPRRIRRIRRIRTVKRHGKRRIKRWTITRIPKGVYPKDLLYYTQRGKIGYTRYYLTRPHYQTKMSKKYIKSVARNEYRDINMARKGIHDHPLIKNKNLDRLATLRAEQAHRHFSHYDNNGRTLAWVDAEKMHLGSYADNQKTIGENMFDVGKLSQVQTNSGVAGYYFKEPSALAGDNVFDSLNNDAASQWAHGENIMMPKNRYVGIGTYYHKSNQTLYVVVEFSVKRPVVHKK